METKLIIVEGLPGSGKSSTAQFIAHQLQRNNILAQWYFEMGMENPADYCFEACLNEKEYKNLISKFSLYGSILDSVVEKKNDKYFIKYILFERMYKDILPEELIDEIAKYDINDREAEIFTELGLLKWEEFNSFAKNTNQVTVLESNFLQGPTVELLLRNKSKTEIKDYIFSIYKRIKDLNPILIYFYQEDIGTSIRKMFDFRGKGFANYVIDMVSSNMYGKESNLSGIELALAFFKDYRDITDELFKELNIQKLSIENSEKNWDSYQNQILKFLNLDFKADYKIIEDKLKTFEGNYRNERIDREFPIKLENRNLFLYVNDTYKEQLIPKDNNSFYLRGSTDFFVFLPDKEGSFSKMVISGRSTAATSGEVGTVFYKTENR